MGDAQSAQREERRDAAGEGETEGGQDVQTEHKTEDKLLNHAEQFSEINGKADSSVAVFNGHCEDDIAAAEEVLSPNKDVMNPLEEETTPLQKDDSNDEAPVDIIEMEAKQNDVNETFQKFFSNIGVKLTVKRGSVESTASHVPEEEAHRFEENYTTARQSKSDIAEHDMDANAELEIAAQEMDANAAQEVPETDSTTCPTMTDGTSEDYIEMAEVKTTEIQVQTDNGDSGRPSPASETNLDATTEDEAYTTSPSIPDEEVAESPFKRFFTTGVFSGLRKKRKSTDNVITEKDHAETEEKQGGGTTAEQDQPQDKQISQGTSEIELVENRFTEEIVSAVSPQTDEAKSCSRKPSVSIVTEPEILSSQEKDKVPASPLKRLLSGSSLKRLSKKPRSRRSSDGKLSDSGELESDHFLSSTESADIQKEGSPSQPSAEAPGVEDNAWASFKKLMTPKKSTKRPSLGNEEAQVPGVIDDAKTCEGEQKSDDGKMKNSRELTPDHILSTTESTENQKEESPARPSAEAGGEEDSAWASFKKLLTPKKHIKRPSVSNEETKISNAADVVKPIEGEQISDHSTEEGKKRKDSSVSWEAVLCGSGRRRSRKTSDSENETPQTGGKQGGESPLERSNEVHETPVSSAKEPESAAESDEGSTWKLFKKLVSPKRKVKDEDGSKDNQHSDSESTQDESFFSIKKLLPGRKKRKSVEKQDQETSDEADKDILSYDEDSETPAVVPLSEFDIAETGIIIQTEADIETYKQEIDQELQKDLLDEIPEATLPLDSVQDEAEETLTNNAPTTPVANEETSDATELVSKHQQLSDIPEEGLITDTMATPASVYEEAVRDDTIADDLIEITSEAMTAPEPIDSTIADETEMISAVSQLSESSKTSGNTTPVPDENSDQDTEALLQQAAENISTNPNAVPVCSDELDSEGIVYSVWNSILKTFGKEKPKEGSASTGLNVETLDSNIDETTAAKTESVSDVNDAISTAIISEVLTEESSPVEIAGDEGDLINDLREMNDAAFSEISTGDETQKSESAVTEEDDHQIDDLEQNIPLIEKSELEISQNVTAQVQVVEQEGRTQLLEKEKQISEDFPLTEQSTNENKQTTYLPEEAVEPEKKESQIDTTITGASGVFEVLEVEEAGTLSSAEDDVLSLRENVPISEYIPPEIVDTTEPKQPTEFLDEVTPESKDSNEASIGTPQTDDESSDLPKAAHLCSEESTVQSPNEETLQVESPEDEPEKNTVPLAGGDVEQTDTCTGVSEVCKAVVANTSDTEPDGLKLPTIEIISGEIETAKRITDGTAPLTRDNVEPERAPEEVQALQAAPSDFEPSSPTSLEKESTEENEPMPTFKKMFQFILDVPAVMKRVKDEPKTETVTTTDTEGQEDTPEIKNTQEPELPEAVPAIKLDSEATTNQSFQKGNISEEIQVTETVPDKTALITEGSMEPDKDPEALHPDQAATLVSEPSSRKLPEREEIPEEVPSGETLENVSKEEVQNDPMPKFKKMFQFLLDVPAVVKKVKEEPKNDSEPPNETIDPEDDSEIKFAQEPEVVEEVPASNLESEASSSPLHDQETNSEEIQAPEKVIDETKPLLGENVGSIDAAEVFQGAPTTTLCSEPCSPELLKNEEIPEDVLPGGISEEIQTPEMETDEKPPLPEENIQPADAPEVIEDTPTATLASDSRSPKLLAKEEIPDDVPARETLKNESKEETQNEPMPKYSVFQFFQDVPAMMKKVIDKPKIETEPPVEMNDPEDDPEIKLAQESELVEAVPASVLEPEASTSHLLDEELTSEENKATEKVRDETTPLPEENVESMDSPEVFQGEPTALLASEPSSPELLEKEEIPEDVPAGDTSEEIQAPESVTDEAILLPKENVEPKDAPEVIESVAAAALDSEPTSPILIEKEDSPKDSPAGETVKNQLTEETQNEPIPKYKKFLQFILDVPGVVKNVTEEPKNETGPAEEVIDLNIYPEVQDDGVLPTTSDSETKSPKLLKNEDTSEEIQTVETETGPHTEGHIEPTDVPDMLEAAPTATVQSEPQSPTLLRKQDISEDDAAAETIPNEPKEETQNEPMPKYKKVFQFILDVPAVMKKVIDKSENELPKTDADPMEVPNIEHVQETQKSEAVPEATSDSAPNGLLLLEEAAVSEDVPLAESVENKTKEENQSPPEVDDDQMDASKIVPVQEEQIQVAVAPLDSEVASCEVHESKIISVAGPTPETAKDEAKEETGLDSEVELVAVEHVEKAEVLQAALDSNAVREEILEDAAEEETIKDQTKEETLPVVSEHARESEMSEAPQTTALVLEEKSEDIPQVETHTVEADKETTSLTEGKGEPGDATKISRDDKPEVLEAAEVVVLDSEISRPQFMEKEEISEDVSAVKTISDEPKPATDVTTELEELPVEPEASSTDITRTAVETEIDVKALESTHEAAPNIEENDAQEKQRLTEDDPKPAADDAIASDGDQTENKTVSQMDQISVITPKEKTESTQLDILIQHEETITATGDEIKTQESYVETAEVSDEPTDVDLKTAVEQAGEINSTREDISAVIPDVSIQTSSEIPEPPIARIASETELVEPIETVTQFPKDNVIETAEGVGEVVLMHAPSVELEDNHRIHVQVADVDVESADSVVETALDVGVTEAKEIVDVCPKATEGVENLSATAEVEKEVTVEGNTVAVEEVIQHAKSLPETIPESEDVRLEQQVIKDADDVKDVAEKVGEESSEVGVENGMKGGTYRPVEEPAVISDSSVTPDQPVTEEHMSAIVESIVSVHEQEEDLVENKADVEKSEVLVLAEDGTSSCNGTEVVELQNTVPSDVESSSARPTPISDQTLDPVNQTDTSGVEEETVNYEKTTQEASKQTEETGVQETAIKEAEENLDPTERAAIANQPLDVDTASTETIETAEQVKCRETATPDPQAAETTQSTTQMEKTDESHCDEESPAEEHTRKNEEENEQEVWLDAEEDMYSPEETEELTPEFESLSNSKIESEDDQQELQKTEGMCETESDGEDFAIALEDLETAIVPPEALD